MSDKLEANSTWIESQSALASPVLLGISALGLVGSAIGWASHPYEFYHGWLVAFLFCLTIVLGMLFFVMLHHVTDSGWSTVVRRPAEQCLAIFPVLLLLFVPMVMGLLSHKLFGWYPLNIDDQLGQKKAAYLNVPFFLVRAGCYFLIWLLLTWIFRGRSIRQDSTGDARLSLSMRRWSAPGMILFALTISFAAFDWVMSLDHHWFSTIFGVYIFSGAAVGGLATLTLIVLVLMRGPLFGKVPEGALHDLGKLIFAFTVWWTYIAFSNYFLIWYANVPEETVFFLNRWQGGWKYVGLALVTGQFILPFFIIMSAGAKKNPRVLVIVSVIILVSHYVDLYWLVQPVLSKTGPNLAECWVDASALLATVGVCGLVFVKSYASARPWPLNDPRLEEALSSGHHSHQDDNHGHAARVDSLHR